MARGKPLEIPKHYAPVCNFLLAALASMVFTGLELRILLLIIRDTYGWPDEENSDGDSSRRRDRYRISVKSLVERTGASDRGVRIALKALVDDGIVDEHQAPSGRASGVYGINSDTSKWKRASQGKIAKSDLPPPPKSDGGSVGPEEALTGTTVPDKREGAAARPEPECHRDRNCSSTVTGTTVPPRVEPQCRSEQAQTQAAQGPARDHRDLLRETLRHTPIESEGGGGDSFTLIKSYQEAKARTDLTADEAAWQAKHYLESVWNRPMRTDEKEDEPKKLAGYLENARRCALEPHLSIAHLITHHKSIVKQNAENVKKGLKRFSYPIAKNIDAANDDLTELDELERQPKKRPPLSEPSTPPSRQSTELAAEGAHP